LRCGVELTRALGRIARIGDGNIIRTGDSGDLQKGYASDMKSSSTICGGQNNSFVSTASGRDDFIHANNQNSQ
jgi:hypothetical protein